MEITAREQKSLLEAAAPAVILTLAAFMLITVAYGLDGIIPMVHDLFHDFRHAIGMPCH